MTAREELLARYRALVLRELPERAARERWVVHADHCLGRVVLDHAVGGRWYDALGRGRGAAFERLSDEQLARAVSLAESIADGGDEVLRPLDAQSLAWRGKAPRRRAAPARG
ncbi:hypothetical protein FHN55_11535 [Streptomyces sp. NP160]|uniref:hypothetical protein n=1 Tax=Streptomyces sp. NP160 TaxID=2586637 RepID=UPI00111A2047|nr:hypothetical protein [Streptomyces sp. NP160]TNM67138.1 hypothetical protein FHN55_11535 [Streptomyces sp. NP160]